MPRIIRRTLTFLVLAGLLLIEPRLSFSSSAERDALPQSTLVQQCADRIEKWFSLLTIQSKELDLDNVRIVLIGDLVVIPLKKPHGNVKAIRWHQKELTDALEVIRLLRQGKIGAVNVLPFLEDPAALYQVRGNLMDELKGCQQKEQVQEVLGQCTECMVREWLELKP
jgi:hypothetical protein